MKHFHINVNYQTKTMQKDRAGGSSATAEAADAEAACVNNLERDAADWRRLWQAGYFDYFLIAVRNQAVWSVHKERVHRKIKIESSPSC